MGQRTTKFIKKLRRPRRNRNKRRRPINVLASVLTTLSLYCGLVSIFASITGHFDKAVAFILFAIVFDTLDGSVARLTKSVSEFGKELDSLCDLVSFGVAPAVLIFTSFLPEGAEISKEAGRLSAIPAIFFVICGALRLARYNVYQSGRRDVFTGLPIPAAGGTIAVFVLFARYFEIQGAVAVWLLALLTLGLACLMVSSVHYPKDKLKLFVLAPQHAFRMLGICAIVIAIFHYAMTRSPAIVLFPLSMAYVLFGIVDELIVRVKQRGQVPDDATAAEAKEEPKIELSQTPKDSGV